MAGTMGYVHTRGDESHGTFPQQPVCRASFEVVVGRVESPLITRRRAMQIQFARDGAPLVPSLPEEIVPSLLQSKALLPSDHYWHEGMPEWMPVEAHWPAPTGNSQSPTGAGSAAGFPSPSRASAAI